MRQQHEAAGGQHPPAVMLRGYFRYDSGSRYRVWILQRDVPELRATLAWGDDFEGPPHAMAGDELWEDQEDRSQVFRLKRHGLVIGRQEWWQVADLFGGVRQPWEAQARGSGGGNLGDTLRQILASVREPREALGPKATRGFRHPDLAPPQWPDDLAAAVERELAAVYLNPDLAMLKPYCDRGPSEASIDMLLGGSQWRRADYLEARLRIQERFEAEMREPRPCASCGEEFKPGRVRQWRCPRCIGASRSKRKAATRQEPAGT